MDCKGYHSDFFTALKMGEGWMLLMMGLYVGGLVGVRHDPMLSPSMTDAWRCCLGSRCFLRILALLLI